MADEIERQAIELDIEIDKGSTFDLELEWREGEGELDLDRPSTWPPLVDNTGFMAEFKMRPVGASRDDNLDFVLTAPARVILGGADGTVALQILASESIAFEWERAEYNILMTDTNDVPFLLAFGKVRAYNTLQEVTPR